MKRIQYRCPKISGRIRIDGTLNDPSWEKAERLEFFVPATLEQPASITHAKLLYDDEFLYIGFKCFDDDIRATYRKRDSFTWEEDVVEVFLKPSPEKTEYFEFEFSPIKTIFDAFIPGPDHIHRVVECSKWNCSGIVVETFIDGTLNDTSDIDRYWSMEIAIPFKGLPVLKGKPPATGDKWLFHLARYDYSYSLKKHRELSSTAYLTSRNFHNYDEWIVLLFAQ